METREIYLTPEQKKLELQREDFESINSHEDEELYYKSYRRSIRLKVALISFYIALLLFSLIIL